MNKLILIIITVFFSCSLGCKTKSQIPTNKHNEEIVLEIFDYYVDGVHYPEILLSLRITNNSTDAIYILKPSQENFALPEFFNVSINPPIESQCEIREAYEKPKSFFIEIPAKSEKTFAYENAFFGSCDDISGQTFNFQVSYDFDMSNKETRNEIGEYYKNEPEFLDLFKKLTPINIQSNIMEIIIPKD